MTKTASTFDQALDYVIDAQLAKRRCTQSDVARECSITVDTVNAIMLDYAENALVERDDSNSDSNANVTLTCDSIENQSRVSMHARLRELYAQHALTRIAALTASSKQAQSTKSKQAVKQTASKQVSERKQASVTATRIQELSRTVDSKQRLTVVTASAKYVALRQTSDALNAHRNERSTVARCIVCDNTHVRSVNCLVCSACYNTARDACAAIKHDRAVMHAMRSMSETELERMIDLCRAARSITIKRYSSKQAAKLQLQAQQ